MDNALGVMERYHDVPESDVVYNRKIDCDPSLYERFQKAWNDYIKKRTFSFSDLYTAKDSIKKYINPEELNNSEIVKILYGTKQENCTVDYFLSGVIFHQSELVGDKRIIKCHGRNSVYEVAYDTIVEMYS